MNLIYAALRSLILSLAVKFGQSIDEKALGLAIFQAEVAHPGFGPTTADAAINAILSASATIFPDPAFRDTATAVLRALDGLIVKHSA